MMRQHSKTLLYLRLSPRMLWTAWHRSVCSWERGGVGVEENVGTPDDTLQMWRNVVPLTYQKHNRPKSKFLVPPARDAIFSTLVVQGRPKSGPTPRTRWPTFRLNVIPRYTRPLGYRRWKFKIWGGGGRMWAHLTTHHKMWRNVVPLNHQKQNRPKSNFLVPPARDEIFSGRPKSGPPLGPGGQLLD